MQQTIKHLKNDYIQLGNLTYLRTSVVSNSKKKKVLANGLTTKDILTSLKQWQSHEV
jgi:hypothetical protein